MEHNPILIICSWLNEKKHPHCHCQQWTGFSDPTTDIKMILAMRGNDVEIYTWITFFTFGEGI